MRRQITSCLMTALLFAASSAAQALGRRPNLTRRSNTVTDIRQVDFLNFNYRSSLCSAEYPGIGKMVAVRNGEFKKKNVYFAVADDRIIYADVTGDGREEAIIPVDCGATGANFSRSEVDVYTVQDGRATLLASLNDNDMERDYRHTYPDAESYWGLTENGLKVQSGKVEIEVLVDGSHAAPKYIATLEYGLDDRTLRLNGTPLRRTSGEN